jgi:anti-sigma factor RsiW
MMEPGTAGAARRGDIDCETTVRRLWDYLDARVSSMAREDVEAHLASCELCAPHFVFAREMRSALAASLPVISSGEESELRYRVRSALRRVAAIDVTEGARGAAVTGEHSLHPAKRSGAARTDRES